MSHLFGTRGVSNKYRGHPVGSGYPIENWSDRPKEARAQVNLAPGEKLSGYLNICARVFHMDKEEDAKAYIEVRDKTANKLFISIDRKVWTNPTTGEIKIFLEWGEPQYQLPKSSKVTHKATGPVE